MPPLSNSGSNWTPLAVGLVGGVIALAVFGVYYHERRRYRTIADGLAARGYRVAQKAEGEAAAIAGLIPLMNTGPKGVKWSARRDRPPRALLEHVYSTGAGKSRQTHVHAAAVAPCPPEWPELRVAAESFLHRIGERIGLKADLRLGDESFDRRWRVVCPGDDSTALALLSPTVRAVLMNAPARDEWWFVGRGVLACGSTSSPSLTTVERLEKRLDAAIAAMDPDLRDLMPETWPS